MCKHGWLSYASRSVVGVGATSLRQGVEFIPRGSADALTLARSGGNSAVRDVWEHKFRHDEAPVVADEDSQRGPPTEAVPFQLSF